MTKDEQLFNLAKVRQTTVWDGYKSLAEFHGGIYECDFVSPFTKGAGNVNADIFIFLQDWASEDNLKGPVCKDSLEVGYGRSVKTNTKLIELLDEHLSVKLSETYATNLFPFIKTGKMNSGISQKDMVKAAKTFGLPQIEIVNPKIAICLGVPTFNALRRACGLKNINNLQEGISSSFVYKNTKFYLQAHTGMLGQNNRNRGGVLRVPDDWALMAREYFEM